MEPKKKIEKIQGVLEGRGQTGTSYQIARILDVAPSTVLRWKAGEAKPRGKQEESLNLLYRTALEVEKGNQAAATILKKLAVPVAGAGLLGLGLAGIVMAAGLGWLLDHSEDEQHRSD